MLVYEIAFSPDFLAPGPKQALTTPIGITVGKAHGRGWGSKVLGAKQRQATWKGLGQLPKKALLQALPSQYATHLKNYSSARRE